MPAELGAGAIVVFWLVVFLIAVLWILMPFAIFGTKPLLRQIIANQEKLIRLAGGDTVPTLSGTDNKSKPPPAPPGQRL